MEATDFFFKARTKGDKEWNYYLQRDIHVNGLGNYIHFTYILTESERGEVGFIDYNTQFHDNPFEDMKNTSTVRIVDEKDIHKEIKKRKKALLCEKLMK